MKPKISFLIFCLFFALISNAYADTLYVNGSYTGGVSNGASWNTPYKTLEDAIAVSNANDAIWMAKGVYQNADADPIHYLIKPLKIIGGFKGTESSLEERDLVTNVTELSGNNTIFSLKQNQLIELDGLKFTNQSTAILYFVGPLANGFVFNPSVDRYLLNVNNCMFENAGTSFYIPFRTKLYLKNSSINSSSVLDIGYSNPIQPEIDYSEIFIENCFIKQQLYLQNSKLTINDCEFHFLSSNPFLTYNSIFPYLIKNCSFKGNGFISSSKVIGQNQIENCTFSDFNNYVILNYVQDLKLVNTKFLNANISSPIIQSKNIELELVEINNISTSCPLIEATQSVDFKNGNINNCKVLSNSDYAVVFKTDNLTFINSTFEQNDISMVKGVNGYVGGKSLIENSTIKNNTNSSNAHLIYVYEELKIKNSNFINNKYNYSSSNTNSFIYVSEKADRSGKLYIEGITMEGNQINYQTLIKSYVKTFIYNSKFNNNSSEEFNFNYSSDFTILTHFNIDTLIIENSDFTNNRSSVSSGIYSDFSRYVSIKNCKFNNNTSKIVGMLNSTSASCLDLNLYDNGQGKYTINIDNCIFSNNLSESLAVVRLTGPIGAKAFLNNNLFKSNITKSGSSILFVRNSIQSEISNSVFESNENKLNGFVLNYDGSGYQSNIKNCTFIKNSSGVDGLFLGLYPEIKNCIFYGNGLYPPVNFSKYQYASQYNISYSNLPGAIYGVGNTDVDPKFVDYANGDYRLSCSSPLINKGNNLYSNGLDLDNKPRIYADTVDMGAYESQINPSTASQIPNPTAIVPTSLCKDEVVTIQNTTPNTSNYTYNWSFGNGTTSTLTQPTCSFNTPGTYTITLNARNFCQQSASKSYTVTVRNAIAPSISTPSLVCPGGEGTYTANTTCATLSWSVIGGTILSGQNTNTIRVLWNNNITSNGKVILNATNCGVDACELPVEVEVPIVPMNIQLNGTTVSCQGATHTYSLINKDFSPSTRYNWTVKGGRFLTASNDYALYDATVQWNTNDTLGVLYLTTYNELLRCGGKDSILVRIRPKLSVALSSSSTAFCVNNNAQLVTTPSSLSNVSYHIQGMNTISSTGQITIGSTPGSYYAFASAPNFSQVCTLKDSVLLEVKALPVVNALNGPVEVDSAKGYEYAVDITGITSDFEYNWSTSNTGDVLSTFENKAVFMPTSFPALLNVSVRPVGLTCDVNQSLTINRNFIPTLTLPDTVCINSSFTANITPHPRYSESYEWSTSEGIQSSMSNGLTTQFASAGLQWVKVKVTTNGITSSYFKNIYVKALPDRLRIAGPNVIDPAGLQTYLYTIDNPSGINYTHQVVGASNVVKNNNQLNITWGGFEPFAIQVYGTKTNQTCTTVPDKLVVSKAKEIDSILIADKPSCLYGTVKYSVTTDVYTKSIKFSLLSGGRVIEQTATTITIEWTTAGTHTLKVDFDRFGNHSRNIPIVVHDVPVPVIQAGLICGDQPINVTTTTSFNSYAWYLNDEVQSFSSQSTLSINKEGLYTVKVIDANGCNAQSTQYIKQLPIPKALVFTNDPTQYCLASGAAITNLMTFEGQDYTYQWYKNSSLISGATSYTLPVQVNLASSSYNAYKVVVSHKTCVQTTIDKYIYVQNCSASSGGIPCNDPVLNVAVNPNSCSPIEFTNSSSPADGYGWNFGDGSFSYSKIPLPKTYTTAGIFDVFVTRGCQTAQLKVEQPVLSFFKLDQPACLGEELLFNDLSVNIPTRKILSWSWDFGDNTQIVNLTGSMDRDIKHAFTSPGTYTVTLTIEGENAFGKKCTSIHTIQVTIKALPVATITPINPSCISSLYQFKSASNVPVSSKEWLVNNVYISNRDTLKQSLSSGAHVVKLRVKDLLGCLVQVNSNVTAVTPYIVDTIRRTGDTVLCNGKQTTLTAPPVGSSFVWRRDGVVLPNTTASITTSTPGSYSVTYSPAVGCSITTPVVKLTNFTLPNLIQAPTSVCEGTALVIKSNLNQPELSHTWLKNNVVIQPTGPVLTINSISPAQAGNYQLKVQDRRNGCELTFPNKAVTVITAPVKPTIKVNANAVCYKDTVKLTASKYAQNVRYSWFRENVDSITTTVDSILILPQASLSATYSVRVKDLTTTCSSTSIGYYVDVAPELKPIMTVYDTVLCAKDRLELQTDLAVKDYYIDWFRNDTLISSGLSNLVLPEVQLKDIGVYKYSAKSKGTVYRSGCVVVSNKKNILIQPSPVIPILYGNSIYCFGDSLRLSTNVRSDFKWNTNSLDTFIYVKSPGTYQVIKSHAINGCTSIAAIKVTEAPLPDVSFVPTGLYERCASDNVVFEGSISNALNQWYLNGKLFVTAPKLYPTQSGDYQLRVTSNLGCVNVSDTIKFISRECPCYVFNTNDAGYGSLREAIECSNTKVGKDRIVFAIAGVGPHIIRPLSPLPTIADSVIINAFTQSGSNLYDVVIDTSSVYNKNALTIDKNISGVEIKGFTFRNFTEDAVSLSNNVSKVIIDSSVFENNNQALKLDIGVKLTTVSNSVFKNGTNGIKLGSNSSLINIYNNAFDNLKTSSIEVGSNAKNNRVYKNTFVGGFAQVRLNTKSYLNKIDSNVFNGYVSNAVLIESESRENAIESNEIGTSMSAFNSTTGVFVANNALQNKITLNKILNQSENGIKILGDSNYVLYNTIENCAIGIYLKNKTNAFKNELKNCTQVGVFIEAQNNKLSQNTFENTVNTIKAIDLHLTKLPAGNGGKTPATVTSYRRATNGSLILSGTSQANDSVELFKNNNIQQQALLFVGATKASNTGSWSVEIPVGAGFNPSAVNYYVNTATSTTNNTSELSAPKMVGCFECICTVTNTNDTGVGSLRAEINNANTGACLTIQFGLQATDVISLNSSLPNITVPLSVQGSVFTNGKLTITGTPSTSVFNFTANGGSVSQLAINNVQSAVKVGASYTVINDLEIESVKRPITLTGSYNSVINTGINSQPTPTSPNTTTDTLVYITGNNNTIGGANAGNEFANGGNAVLVRGGTGNSILNNTFLFNTQAIQLVNSGNQNHAAPTNMVGIVNGSTITVTGKAKAGDTIQLFNSTYYPQQATGFAAQAIADASGNWTATFNIPASQINQNNYFVATATNTSGSTSKLSSPFVVGNYPQQCYVTTTADDGFGSLREAIRCVNTAGTANLSAEVVFQLPTTSINTIQLLSGLTITNPVSTLIDAGTVPVKLTTSSNITALQWSVKEVSIKHLQFENFNTALQVNGKLSIIDSNAFVNNATSIAMQTTDTAFINTIRANTFGGGNRAIASTAGSLVIQNNRFGVDANTSYLPISGYAINAERAQSITLQNNRFDSVTVSTGSIVPTDANGYAVRFDRVSVYATGNTINGSVTSPGLVLLINNYNSQWILNRLYHGSTAIKVQQSKNIAFEGNNIISPINTGIDASLSQQILFTKNTITGLTNAEKPLVLNLATSNVSNSNKVTPQLFTSAYRNGSLFLTGKTEPSEKVEIFYSDSLGNNLVKYIRSIYSDSVGNFTISFPIAATAFDTTYFAAVATKNINYSSEASATYSPNLRVCMVRNTLDSGAESLRDAITKANQGKCNIIQFDITASNKEIIPASTLPLIQTSSLIIDATSQPGYQIGNPLIKLTAPFSYALKSINTQQLNVFGMHINTSDTAVAAMDVEVLDVQQNKITSSNKIAVFGKGKLYKYGEVSNNAINDIAVDAIQLSNMDRTSVKKNSIQKFGLNGIKIVGQLYKVEENTIYGNGLNTNVAIYLNGVNHFVSKNKVNQVYNGIVLQGSNGTQCISNTIGGKDSVSLANNYSVKNKGIQVVATSNARIRANSSTHMPIGVWCDNSNLNTIELNTLIQNDTSIYSINSNDLSIKTNNIDSTNVGIELTTSKTTLIFNNKISGFETAGIRIGTNSDFSKIQGNLIGVHYITDTSFSNGTGIITKSSKALIGASPSAVNFNFIYHCKKGGILVDGGTQNLITYNYFSQNDTAKARPTQYAIKLINNGNNNKVKPNIVRHKKVGDELIVEGTAITAGDSIHLYNCDGLYEQALRYVGYAIVAADKSWSITLDSTTVADKLPKGLTWAFVATASSTSSDTSPLSAMYLAGDCYITSLKDNMDNSYPLPNTLRMAVKCANGQDNYTRILSNVSEAGAKEVKLARTLMPLINPHGILMSGYNKLDGQQLIVQGSNMDSTLWVISNQAVNTILDSVAFKNATSALTVAAKNVTIKRTYFDAFETGVLLNGNNGKITTCIFDTLETAIEVSSSNKNSVIEFTNFKYSNFAIRALQSDSLMIKSNQFDSSANNTVLLSSPTKSYFATNIIKQSKNASRSNVIWSSSEGEIKSNTIYGNKYAVYPIVRVDHSDSLLVIGNTFRDSTSIYLQMSQSNNSKIVANNFARAQLNSIVLDTCNRLKVESNSIYSATNDAIHLRASQEVWMTRNTVTQVRKTSDTDSALCIKINKYNPVISSNASKEEPTNLNYEVKAGIDGRVGIHIQGKSAPSDSVEIYFSDSTIASMNQYVVTAKANKFGDWEVKLPREFYHRDTVTWYHCVAVAIDTITQNTSQTSSVLHIPPQYLVQYIRFTDNDGPNTLRQAIDTINVTDVYSYAIFKIDLPSKVPGPYNIQLDSVLSPVYSYNGFVMDGSTQKMLVPFDTVNDYRIIVRGDKILKDSSKFSFHMVDSSYKASIKNLEYVNHVNAWKIENNENEIENINIYTTDFVRRDSAFVVRGNKNELKNIYLSNYRQGLMLSDTASENNLNKWVFNQMDTAVVVTDSSNNNFWEEGMMTSVDYKAFLFDNAGVGNEVTKYVFGKQNQPVNGNTLCILNSKGVNFFENRISYYNPSSPLTSATKEDSSIFFIKGNSALNVIENNTIGYDSLRTSMYSSPMIAYYVKPHNKNYPIDNSFILNEVNGIGLDAIRLDSSARDIISTNWIGIDRDSIEYNLNATGLMANQINDAFITDNRIVGYTTYGIDLRASDRVQMHRNVIYSNLTLNKAIQLNPGTSYASNSNGSKTPIPNPIVTEGILIDTQTVRVKGTGMPNVTVEVYSGVKDSAQSIRYLMQVPTDANGDWIADVPRVYLKYNNHNQFVAQHHSASQSSEYSKSLRIEPLLCQLANNPSIKVLDPLYTPCPGPAFKLSGGLDNELTYKWIAPTIDTVRTRIYELDSTVADIDLYVSDTMGCLLKRSTSVLFKAKPVQPDFIISSTVYAQDTLVLVDISVAKIDTLQWYSSPGVAVLSTSSGKTIEGSDGKIYPAETPHIQFILPDSGTYNIRQTSIRNGCFVELNKEIKALPFDPFRSNPTFINQNVSSLYAYPNPAIQNQKVSVVIKTRTKDPINVTLYSLNAIELTTMTLEGSLTYSLSLNATDANFNTMQLASGMYILKVTEQNDSFEFKLIIQ